MKHLTIHNQHYITYKDSLVEIDVLGGVDVSQVERMVCTLRITHKDNHPYRTTLDLYSDNQTDKLIRTLCEKWTLKLIEVSRSLYGLTLELEEYRLSQLKYKGGISHPPFVMSEADKKKAVRLLRHKDVISKLTSKFNAIGILGEDTNALILYMALASYKYSNPFSVLAMAKSSLCKSEILQTLSGCMPQGSYSYHNRISANALYYFDSNAIANKALIIEDLEFTKEMLRPLATLQNQGRLINTRTTKDRNGMLHSTTFEVIGRLCLLACISTDKNYEHLGLPFLMLQLNQSQSQDMALMNYQRQMSANLLNYADIQKAQQELKCVIASLENITVVNPYATMIALPESISNPRQSLSLLLHFIEIITYIFQYQRNQYVDETTGETIVETTPDDIALAYDLLKDSLFRKADELAGATRTFYNWLTGYLQKTEATEFTALAIRKEKAIHPRTLNRYLQELKLYNYIKVVGGNKHRGGYQYTLTELGNEKGSPNHIQQHLNDNLNAIRNYAQEGTHITQLDS